MRTIRSPKKMDDVKDLDLLHRRMDAEFLGIINIVNYLNREVSVNMLPDHIRCMDDAYTVIEEWNIQVKKAQQDAVELGYSRNFNYFEIKME